MINRNGNFKGWLALLLLLILTISLIGWNTYPKPAPNSVSTDSPTVDRVALRSTSVQDSRVGKADIGRNLFMGRLHFQNGGPPCMGCHNVGSNGLLGGGALGPDLTNVSTKRSQEEISSILSNHGQTMSPVMQPIFSEHPLTESEQADLIAFLNASVGQPESNKEILVIGISLAGFVAAVFALGFVYRNRLRGVRKTLIKKAL